MKIKNKRGFERERAKSYSTQKPLPKNYDAGKAVGGGGAYSYLCTDTGSPPYLAQHHVPERISEADERAEAGGGDLARSGNSVEVFAVTLPL